MRGRHGQLERRRGVRLRSGKGSHGDPRSRAVRRAIAASLLLHCLVAVVAVVWKPRRPPAPSEAAISVDIAVSPGAEEPANAASSQAAAIGRSVQLGFALRLRCDGPGHHPGRPPRGLPEGTELGYRAAELLALNGRRTSRGQSRRTMSTEGGTASARTLALRLRRPVRSGEPG